VGQCLDGGARRWEVGIGQRDGPQHSSCSAGAGMRTATGLWAIWVTSEADRADHAVTDEQMAAGMKAGAGVYRAVCGAEVLAAPLVTPPAPRCPACGVVLRGQAATGGTTHQAGALARLFGRVRTALPRRSVPSSGGSANSER
jgi:hypothetical protein